MTLKKRNGKIRIYRIWGCFIVLFDLLIVCGACGSVTPEPREVYLANKPDFKEVEALRNSLQRRYPTCYSLEFYLTARDFWQHCDSIKPNPDLPETFLTDKEREFLGGFMYTCGFKQVNMSPKSIRFICVGYRDQIVRMDTAYPNYKQYEIDSLYYLLPYSEKVPH
jgi:hypothetical protein